MRLVETVERAGGRLKAAAHLRTRFVLDTRPLKRADTETVFFEVAGRNAKMLFPVVFRIFPKGAPPPILKKKNRPRRRSRI